MKNLKATVAIGFLLFLASGMGCTNPKFQSWPYVHSCTETLGETPEEHHHRTRKVADRDAKALAEDFDIFFMTDRPSRLNRWQDE